MRSLRVVLASPAQAGVAASLLRLALPARLRRRTVFGCDGMRRAIAAEIALGPVGDCRYLLAVSGRAVLGCAQVRRVAGGLFLNQIAVRREARGRGAGTALLREMLPLAGPEGGTLALDVFEENHAAAEWYRSLGLSARRTATWWEARIPRTGAQPLAAAGAAPATAAQARFGFSELFLIHARGTYRVGRLGRGLWRCTDPALPRDARALAALARLDPRRRLLLILPGRSARPPLPGARPIARSVRMGGDLSRVAARLGLAAPGSTQRASR